MKTKLESGREVDIKDLSVDERDELLDNVETETVDDGIDEDKYLEDGVTANANYGKQKKSIKIKTLHSTMTKFVRMGVKRSNDKFLKSLSFSEKTEIFQLMQEEYLNLGEGKASN